MHIQPHAESACASNMFVSYFASKYADVGTASCFCRVCFTSDEFLLHVPSFGVSLIKFYYSCVKPLVFFLFHVHTDLHSLEPCVCCVTS